MHEQMKRLYQAAKELKAISVKADLAKFLNESSQTINNWEKRGISKSGMLNAQKLIGCSAIWLETGKGSISLDLTTHTHKSYVHSGLGLPDTKSVLVHMFDAVGSMGCGICQPENDTITSSLWLAEQWIRSNLERSITSTKNLAIITGHGDSMSPTFNDGDILLIDTGIKHVNIDGVYVLSANNRLYIKRVRQRLDGQFEISSDNQTVKTVDILNGEHEITIHGRVVWAWNGKKL